MIAYNDPFVMSAWAKANGIKNSDFFVSFLLLPSPSWPRRQLRLSTYAVTLKETTLADACDDALQVFASDAGTKFSQSIDWTAGERTARYAIAVDHGKVIYASKEEGGGIEASGAEAVIAKL